MQDFPLIDGSLNSILLWYHYIFQEGSKKYFNILLKSQILKPLIQFSYWLAWIQP